jgi:ABC-2 type transport system ATP-binding protein
MKAIEIINLKKSFKSNFYFNKTEVLKDINLNVGKGEIYGFLGPNGAGKTTTMKCLLHLINPDSGQMNILGEPSNKIKVRNKIGFLPEHPYFYTHLTGEELLRFYARLFSLKISDSKIQHFIKKVGLGSKGKIKIQKYSKGMMQRIGLAQSIINDPEIIILDEPFTGLDPIGRKELRDIILQLKNEGKTIFFSSHILQDIEIMVDRVGIILDGTTIKEGKMSDLTTHTADYFELIFFGIDKKILTDYESRISTKDDKYFLKVNEKEKNDVIEKIILSKGKIISITPIKMTLEDIFLKEIKNEN